MSFTHRPTLGFKHFADVSPLDQMHMQVKQKRGPYEEVEIRFSKCMEGPLKQAEQIGEADIIVGVPFYNEADTLPDVLQVANHGLRKFYPDAGYVILAAGSPEGGDALQVIQGLSLDGNPDLIAFTLNDELLNGKGWSIRAIFEVANKLGADVALLEADLISRTNNSGEIEGLVPDWIKFLLEPIRRNQMDLVISKFNRHHLEAPVSALTYPLFTAIYNCPIRRLTGGQWGIAHHLLSNYLGQTRYGWYSQISGYGVDSWLATIAITNNARICEANMGIKIRQRSAAKAELVLRQVVQALFSQILHDSEWWERPEDMAELPLRRPLPSFGIQKQHRPDPVKMVPEYRMTKYKEGFNKFHRLYEVIFPNEVYQELEKLAKSEANCFSFPYDLWAGTVYHLILAYAFNKAFARDDIVSSALALYHGFEASNALSLQELQNELKTLAPEKLERLLWIESEIRVEDMVREFLRQKSMFLFLWEKETSALKPIVPPITYREFIPGVPLVVPTELVSTNGDIVTANGIYDSIFSCLKEEFEQFIYHRLNVPRAASSLELSLTIKDFLRTVEEQIFQGEQLSTIKGTHNMVSRTFTDFPHGDSFALTDEAASWLLGECPPLTMIAKLDYTRLTELLQKYNPTYILALSKWTEEREYIERLWRLMDKELRPEHFVASPIKFIVVKHQDFPSLVELRESSALDKLTSTIVVSNLHKGMGGEFPKLRYFTTIAKDIVEAERFGQTWKRFAEEKKDFGRKVVNSIRGHFGKEPFSAHNIFEDGNQRILVDRLRQMANKIWDDAGDDELQKQLAAKIAAIADSYHLAMVLPDGKFVTCSAWSWASYSFKGGKTSPSPLSVHVERDWASREFLVEYYKALGGTEEEVEEKIIDLIGQGRESEDLAPILLGTEKEAKQVVPVAAPALTSEQPLAGQLKRIEGNPILKPIANNHWESKYVLNAGAIKLEGRVYLIYRAFGDDGVSRLGLAISSDGFDFYERLPEPIFQPTGKHDSKGCEDPRLTVVGERIYMTYTIFDGAVAQIALASIGIDEFIKYRWKSWRRHGRVFPSFTDKDAALFPEQFKGRYAMLHRVDPHIWITFSTHLRCPWSRKKHKILAGSTSGMMWDGHKIGAGAQPIKTQYGWLLVTHGVDYNRVYRLGVMVLDLSDPSKLIYRSPNYVLEPSEEWELGKGEESWVSNVVFSCGAVTKGNDKGILDAEDEVIVYYGAADSVICAATAKVGTLIPCSSSCH